MLHSACGPIIDRRPYMNAPCFGKLNILLLTQEKVVGLGK